MRPTPWRLALGARVRARRDALEWSLRRAEVVSGVPEATWRHLEAGRQVGDHALIGVAEAFGWDRGECFRILADALDKQQG